MQKYERIPLSVGVVYSKSGKLLPVTISVNGERFVIDKVGRQRRFCPPVVTAIAPIEFTVFVAGEEKKIYFEEDTSKWFSVKKYERN